MDIERMQPDVEEIKEWLIDEGKDAESAITDALLWLINKAEETPMIEVARLEPGDKLVYHADKPVSIDENELLTKQLGVFLPGHEVVIVDRGRLSIMGEVPTEISQLRGELQRQWESNHSEHCREWPHAGDCYWPRPAILGEEPA